MKEKFWKFMDSAKGFLALIITMIVAGGAYMIGAKKMIDEIIKRRDK